MEKTKFIKGIVALSVLAVLGGGIIAANAASNHRLFGPKNQATAGPAGQKVKLTAEQKVEMKTKMEERQKEMQAKWTAIQTAMNNSDYQAWLTAVGSDNPMVKKITVDNFSKLVEAYKLRQQANKIMEDLGLGKGDFDGCGMGMRMGMGVGGQGHARGN